MLAINTDGASRGNPGLSGIGVVIKRDGYIITEYKEFIGQKTNNQAEYSALKKALEIASAIDNYATILSDSELVINQRNNKMKVRNKQLKIICMEISKLERHFNSLVYRHIPREKNTEADFLANKAIDEYLKYQTSKV